jgi:hypothetical protein
MVKNQRKETVCCNETHVRLKVFTTMTILMLFFWDKPPCGLVDTGQRLGEACYLHLQGWSWTSLQSWRWRQHGPPKLWHLATSPQGALSQKNIIRISIYFYTSRKRKQVQMTMMPQSSVISCTPHMPLLFAYNFHLTTKFCVLTHSHKARTSFNNRKTKQMNISSQTSHFADPTHCCKAIRSCINYSHHLRLWKRNYSYYTNIHHKSRLPYWNSFLRWLCLYESHPLNVL